MSKVLILRPQPGARETAARAAALGLEPVVAPLFTVGACAWRAPEEADFDAVMLTSANAARFAGAGLAPFLRLPCYAVGESTAAAARAAGFTEVHVGSTDGRALVELAVAGGTRRILHLCGRDHRPLDDPRLTATRRLVYAAHGCDTLPGNAVDAIADGALVLLHSPRAAALFAHLADAAALDRKTVSIAAISQAAATAAGRGWRRTTVAGWPRDEALLELAAKLCKSDGGARAKDSSDEHGLLSGQ
jgi:uroporphyrinogen-III synthase